MKHAIPFLTTIFITTIGLCSINAQGKDKSANGLTAKTEVLAFHIANVNEVHGPAIGFAGTKSKQFERFEELSRHASISELVTLTGHGNAAVRVYAYWALESKNYNGLATIKPKMKDDTTEVSYMTGCVISKQTVSKIYGDAPLTFLKIGGSGHKIVGITGF